MVFARKLEEGQLVYIQGKTGTETRDTHAELENLEVGQYLIYVSIDWNENTPKKDRFFSISSYGEEGVELSIDPQTEKHHDLLFKIFLS